MNSISQIDLIKAISWLLNVLEPHLADTNSSFFCKLKPSFCLVVFRSFAVRHDLAGQTSIQIICHRKYTMMKINQIKSYGDSKTAKIASEFLKAITHTPCTKRVLVHFKFKRSRIEYREWVTNRQYVALSTMQCIEFCNVQD